MSKITFIVKKLNEPSISAIEDLNRAVSNLINTQERKSTIVKNTKASA